MVRLRGASSESHRRHTCNQLAGTGPAFFSRFLNVRPLSIRYQPYLVSLDPYTPEARFTPLDDKLIAGGGSHPDLGGVGRPRYKHLSLLRLGANHVILILRLKVNVIHTSIGTKIILLDICFIFSPIYEDLSLIFVHL